MDGRRGNWSLGSLSQATRNGHHTKHHNYHVDGGTSGACVCVCVYVCVRVPAWLSDGAITRARYSLLVHTGRSVMCCTLFVTGWLFRKRECRGERASERQRARAKRNMTRQTGRPLMRRRKSDPSAQTGNANRERQRGKDPDMSAARLEGFRLSVHASIRRPDMTCTHVRHRMLSWSTTA